MFHVVGIAGAIGWLGLTLFARAVLAEIVVLPMAALGFAFRRRDAFWIGWIRTFSNQILPMSGMALFVQEIRRKVSISWSALVALSSPQFLLAAAGLGAIGVVASVLNFNALAQAGLPILTAFVAVTVGSVAVATGAARLMESMPGFIASRIRDVATSFRRLAEHPHLVPQLIAWHCVAILAHGGRVWLLFSAVGISLDWREALLVMAVAESTMLLQITPGGLGLREGAVVGGAALLGIPAEAAAGVALIDRLFMIGLTTLLAGPAFFLIRGR